MALIVPGWSKPLNADCAWSAACGFWRAGSSVCPVKMRIFGNTYAGSVSDMPSIFGDFLGGTPIAVAHCAGSNAYIDKVGGSANELQFDIWKALADGLWSSSAAFTIQGARRVTLGSGSCSITVRPHTTTNPAAITRAVTVTAVDACPTETIGTLTVYDDGTYTFA